MLATVEGREEEGLDEWAGCVHTIQCVHDSVCARVYCVVTTCYMTYTHVYIHDIHILVEKY